MDDIKAKQQIVEKIKSSTNILVTVSNDPSVDALSAALGLSLLLNKLDKHPTAVFSGAVPPAISFLEPEKTFDTTTDSLRDFIIALDKEKADHLRYKVEGDSVKIFITPYKTTISSDDLEYSQGDFNVELVIALGVDNQDHLDGALDAHGQILHDATIITVTAGEQTSDLGGIDWHDDQASSLSEMIGGLAEALKPDKKSLLDASIATAFLTGIVAATDRFSNTHTTARVMTIAAQLMAGGADQQLIASKLQESQEVEVADESSEQADAQSAPRADTEEAPKHKEVLSIEHAPRETLEQLDARIKSAEQQEAADAATASLDKQISSSAAAGAYAFTTEATPITDTPIVSTTEEPTLGSMSDQKLEPSVVSEKTIEPSFGGTLNATTEQAADDARREVENDQNKTILSHAYMQTTDVPTPVVDTPTDAAPVATPSTGAASYVLGHEDAAVETTPAPQPVPVDQPAPATQGTFGHELVIQPITESVAPTPSDLGLPMPPALPDFSPTPVAGSAYSFTPAEPPQPERLGDILAPEEPVAPPVPPSTPPPLSPPASTPPSNDPGQFKIPGQQ